MKPLYYLRLERPTAANKPGMEIVGYLGGPGEAWEPLMEPQPGTAQGVNTLEGWNALAARMGGTDAR